MVKIGKSEFVNKLSEYIIEEEGNKIALFKLEEEPDVTCKKVAGKLKGYDFTNPEKVLFLQEDGTYTDIYGTPVDKDVKGFFTQEILSDAVDSVGDNIIYYNRYGGDAKWADLKGAIKHAVLVQGCQDIVIDPLTRLTTGMEASKANQELETFSDEISKMAKDFGFTYYVFCHLKSPDSGPPHEMGGKVHSSQFFGSRAMMRTCYYTIGLERNKSPDIPLKQRSKTKAVILDDRKYGRNGYFYIYYDPDTSDYIEPPEGFFAEGLEDILSVAEFEERYPNGLIEGTGY